MGKVSKLKFRNFGGLVPRFVEVTGEKLLGEKLVGFLVPLFLIFTFTLKMQNSILDYLTNEITLASIL